MAESIASKVLNLKNLIDYQTDAIVSRVLVRKQSGNVTLFAFDTGQELSEHTAPFDALVYVLDGEARITLDGTDHNVREGEILLMPANVPHALMAENRFKMLLIMIKSQ